MKVLAMDLSLSSPAFAILTVVDGKVDVLHLSSLKTKAGRTQNHRLFEIFIHLKQIYEKHPEITEVVREKGFSRFPSVTQILFRVVGVSDICSYIHGGFEEIAELAPTTVKKSITGNGRASKQEVMDALSTNYGVNIKFKNDDESDAVAVGITYMKQKKVLA